MLWLKRLFALALLIASALALVGVWLYPHPVAASYLDLLGPLLWSTVPLLILFGVLLSLAEKGIQCKAGLLIMMSGLVALALMLYQHYRFYDWKNRVLQTRPALLQQLGKHFVIGYRDDQEISMLARTGAIAGIYITTRNIRGKSIAQIRQHIDQLQALRHQAGLAPLIVTADQEGGLVSRMSPPLPRLPTLRKHLENSAEKEQLNAAFEYGKTQGEGLTRLGVTVNFSPVIDLIPTKTAASDKYTLIYRRAISDDPQVVTQLAMAYLQGLECAGIRGTLKHFPGLGKVYGDTHLEAASLDVGLDTLERQDWIPFRKLLARDRTLLMVGHVQLPALDPHWPASVSREVLKIIREDWDHQGVLITDDLSMDAAYALDKHLLATARRSLNAGMDLLLISYDVRQFYPAMAGLIDAWQNDEIHRRRVEKSAARLKTIHQPLTCQSQSMPTTLE